MGLQQQQPNSHEHGCRHLPGHMRRLSRWQLRAAGTADATAASADAPAGALHRFDANGGDEHDVDHVRHLRRVHVRSPLPRPPLGLERRRILQQPHLGPLLGALDQPEPRAALRQEDPRGVSRNVRAVLRGHMRAARTDAATAAQAAVSTGGGTAALATLAASAADGPVRGSAAQCDH